MFTGVIGLDVPGEQDRLAGIGVRGVGHQTHQRRHPLVHGAAVNVLAAELSDEPARLVCTSPSGRWNS